MYTKPDLRLWLLPIVVAMLLSAIGTAAAGEPILLHDLPRDPSKAADAFARGKEQYADGKLEAALKAFRDAERLDPGVGTYLANLGTVELALGRHRAAAEHTAQALAVLEKEPANAGKLGPLREILQQARQEVATLQITVNVDAALINIDDVSVAVTPSRELFVKPGEHIVRVTREGYEPRVLPLTAAAGQTYQLEVALVAVGRAKAPPEAPADPGDADAGPGPEPAILGIGYGVAGAALVAGIVLTSLANDKDSEADALVDRIVQERGERPCDKLADATCYDIYVLRGDQDTLAIGAIWSYIGAGALAASTTVYAVYMLTAGSGSGTPQPTEDAMIAPLYLDGGGGLSVFGVW